MENANLEIDVLYLLKKLWNRKFLIVFIAALGAAVALVGSIFLITPQYTSTTRIYVVNNSKDGNSITTSDLQAGDYLVNDYKEIITSNEVLQTVVRNENLSISSGQLSSMLSVSIPSDTRVISISVENENPQEASDLANAIREVASEKIKSVTKVQDVTTLEVAEASTTPSSPNVKRNVVIGLLVGGFVSVVIILLVEVLDDRVKRPEDIEEVLGMTLLGVVPNTDKL
ncbi:Wzz/FepE/Etk N-terminal domain-containing protein [Streptococcus loxodontisalivarius]|uniref:Capsular polysaccharide biosynthesis protein CpsC n=1 Tax=Streptococcus loxodontisalivarius TaxID=1349415 RepID=A0ABS2PQW6_9STRE|nr:Wzz/FepE/Etk N-terminal domain-containing protein [Streptococcus loxodontisalivarius]MBM7641767.1 MPA1 family polysaccharide export protein [Streptococcus loxodontisalivarius]